MAEKKEVIDTKPVTTAGDDDSNELMKAVDEMLENLTNKFTKVSTEVFARLDEMGQKLDELEASIKAEGEASSMESS